MNKIIVRGRQLMGKILARHFWGYELRLYDFLLLTFMMKEEQLAPHLLP